MRIVRLTHAGRILDVAISHDAGLLAYTPIDAGNHSLWIWNLSSGKKWELVPPHPALCWGMKFTKDGQTLFYNTTQPNTTISVLHRIAVHGRGIQPPRQVVVNIDSPIALSPDAQRIAFVRSFQDSTGTS